MNKIIFASHNKNKVQELKDLFSDNIIISLNEIGFEKDIKETGSTIEENALIKVREIFNFSQSLCISDDTCLEISCLNGEPGVFSARYAGRKSTAIDNMKKVLQKLKNISNRKARFRTVIAFKDIDREMLFEGIVHGNISNEIRGKNGFGYDSIFIPHGYDLTFAEMPKSLKNQISHRGIAIKKLHQFILSKEFFS